MVADDLRDRELVREPKMGPSSIGGPGLKRLGIHLVESSIISLEKFMSTAIETQSCFISDRSANAVCDPTRRSAHDSAHRAFAS